MGDYGDYTSNTYKGAGCRYKGAVGSLLHCLNPKTGRPNGKCRKLSLKVDANYFRDDKQKIDGMKRVNFHGMAADNSLVSERIAYNLLRKVGVAASCATHAELYVNGEFDGVYAIVQDPTDGGLGKDFFKDDANEGDGAFYKDYWFRPEQANHEWLEDHSEGENEHDYMLQVTNAINAASERDCTMLESYIDLDTFAKITAVNDLIGASDDWRLRHNFQWYVKKDAIDGSKKLVMIPWDYDRLDDKQGGLPLRRKLQSGWVKQGDPNSQQCTNPPKDPTFWQIQYATGLERVILQRKTQALPPDAGMPIECDKITRMLKNCAYDKTKEYFLQYQVQYSSSELNANIDRYASKIKQSVAKDSSISTWEWQNGLQSLKVHFQTSPSYAGTKGSSSSAATGINSLTSFTNFGVPSTNNFGGSGPEERHRRRGRL